MERLRFVSFAILFIIYSKVTTAQSDTLTKKGINQEKSSLNDPSNSLSERKKIRYLKRISKKNDRYLKIQEKKTKAILARLSRRETQIINQTDSLRKDSILYKNSFSDLDRQFLNHYSPSTNINQNLIQAPTLNSISKSIDSREQDYLRKQLTTCAFLNDTSCKVCSKLQKQEKKTQEVISKTSQKLEYLKSVQDKIKKREEFLRDYFSGMPQYANQLQGLEKEFYYFNQGLGGFRTVFITPASGIENNLIQTLSFNKAYTSFSNNLRITEMPGLNIGVVNPDLRGYQTIAQVQNLLPQNAPGITPDQKATLVSNIKNSLTQFQKLRDKNPQISILKDKTKGYAKGSDIGAVAFSDCAKINNLTDNGCIVLLLFSFLPENNEG